MHRLLVLEGDSQKRGREIYKRRVVYDDWHSIYRLIPTSVQDNVSRAKYTLTYCGCSSKSEKAMILKVLDKEQLTKLGDCAYYNKAGDDHA